MGLGEQKVSLKNNITSTIRAGFFLENIFFGAQKINHLLPFPELCADYALFYSRFEPTSRRPKVIYYSRKEVAGFLVVSLPQPRFAHPKYELVFLRSNGILIRHKQFHCSGVIGLFQSRTGL